MKILRGIGIALAVVGLFAIAIVTMPETNNCTPRLIARYTNIMISYQECESESMPRCIIEPKDIRDFHNAQLSFRQCVLEITKAAEESETE